MHMQTSISNLSNINVTVDQVNASYKDTQHYYGEIDYQYYVKSAKIVTIPGLFKNQGIIDDFYPSSIIPYTSGYFKDLFNKNLIETDIDISMLTGDNINIFNFLEK